MKLETIIFANLESADEIVKSLRATIKRYGNATVADYKDFAGLSVEFKDTEYGWTDPSLFTTRLIHLTNRGWRIDFPPVEKLGGKQMNVYISVPMSGRTIKEVEADIKQAKKDFPFNKRGTKYISNLLEFKEEIDPATALGNAIESILSCDALYACPGWKESKVCRVEIATAILYDIPVYGLPSTEMEVVIKKKPIKK